MFRVSIQILVSCAVSMLITACKVPGLEEYQKLKAAHEWSFKDEQERSAILTNRPKSQAIRWNQINTGLQGKHTFARKEAVLFSLTIDPLVPNTLYGGAEYQGAFKSTNGGMSWQEINSGLPLPLHIWCILVDPKVPSTVYAGTGGSGIFKSTNGGASWSAVNTGIPTTTYYIDKTEFVDGTHRPTIAVPALAIDPQNPNTLYVSIFGSGIYKSTNGGGNWNASNAELTLLAVGHPRSQDIPDEISAIAVDPQMSNKIYAGTARNGVYKSMDGGESWSKTTLLHKETGNIRGRINRLVIDPKVPSTVYTATMREGVFKSTDGGVSWSAVNAGLKWSGDGYHITALAIDPQISTTLYAGADYGVFISLNAGASWAQINTGLPVLPGIQVVSFLAIDPQVSSTIYAGMSTITGVYKSTNAGAR